MCMHGYFINDGTFNTVNELCQCVVQCVDQCLTQGSDPSDPWARIYILAHGRR